MRFKATLRDAKCLLGILQVCRSIQSDCIVRLHAERIRFFSNTNATDGVQVWMACESSFLFSEMICESGNSERSITCEVLDLAQLLHIVKQAEVRERSPLGSNPHVQIRLARSGRCPLWRVAMPGLSGQPDISFDVPLRIISDRESGGLAPPPLQQHHLHIVVPDMMELATFVDKLKNTAADSVTFAARALRRGRRDGGAAPHDDEGGVDGRHSRKRRRDGDDIRRAALVIHAEHVVARFSLKYEAVELAPPPSHGAEDADGDEEADEDEDGDADAATVTVETRKFARFFSAVRMLDPVKISMYLVDERALVLSVYAVGTRSMVAYIPAKA
ncbi:Checkpoint protein HUS1 [Novymonas esmeraldas]|uniref:Checkpoint protein n=1 Tax=Novymonas esmeraldas TaxID=1808958 RepID=A0AAW0EQ38_9TRYP